MARKIAEVAVNTKLKANEDSGDDEDTGEDTEDNDEELPSKLSVSTTKGKSAKKGFNKKIVYAGLAFVAACGVGFAIYKMKKGGK